MKDEFDYFNQCHPHRRTTSKNGQAVPCRHCCASRVTEVDEQSSHLVHLSEYPTTLGRRGVFFTLPQKARLLLFISYTWSSTPSSSTATPDMTSPATSNRHLLKVEKRPKIPHRILVALRFAWPNQLVDFLLSITNAASKWRIAVILHNLTIIFRRNANAFRTIGMG